MRLPGHTVFHRALPLAALLVTGCGGGIIDGGGGAQLELLLTDAPAVNAEAVYVNVETTQVNFVPDDPALGTEGWQSVSSVPVTYDLLLLQGGVTASLGEIELSAGTITEIRLILDAGEPGSIEIDGQSHPLTVPSGAESGLKLQGDIPLVEGQVTSVVIDFDAAQSVVESGSGEYHLRPVLTLQSVDTAPETF